MFNTWWNTVGSDFIAASLDDHKEHAKKIAAIAWKIALLDAANKFEGAIAYNWMETDGYANAFDIARELRRMASESDITTQSKG